MSTSYSNLSSSDLDNQLGKSDEPMSTLINHPQNEQRQPDNINMLVDGVINQAENDSNINGEFLNHQLDHSQIPYEQDFPQEYQQQYNPQQFQMMNQYEQPLQPTLVERLTYDSKLSVVVIVLFVLLSLPQFNQLLTRFFPRFLSDAGGLSMSGLLAKAVLCGLVFMLVKFIML
jgi:hypothetical protein